MSNSRKMVTFVNTSGSRTDLQYNVMITLISYHGRGSSKYEIEFRVFIVKLSQITLV